MIFLKAFYIVGVAVAAPVILAALVLSPMLLFVLGFSGLAIPVYFYGFLATVFSPVGFFCCFAWSRSWLVQERHLVLTVGPEKALWATLPAWATVDEADYVTFIREGDSKSEPLVFDPEVWTSLSVFYSDMVLTVSGWVAPQESLWVASSVAVVLWIRSGLKLCVRLAHWLIFALASVVSVLCLSPASVSGGILIGALRLVWYFTPLGLPALRLRLEWARLYLASLLVDLAGLAVAFDNHNRKYFSSRLQRRAVPVSVAARSVVMKSATFIANVRLPQFVRNRFTSSGGYEGLVAGREILESLGWPVNVDVAPVDPEKTVKGAKIPSAGLEWELADTSFATGIRQLKLEVEQGLAKLNEIAAPYERTEEYKTVENELKSTSRYFAHRKVSIPVDVLDDVWHTVKPIFANSRLTSFNTIISLWNKKYAMGFWMVDETGRRKVSRRSFINKVGYSKFKEMWARTFVRASEIMPVSHVSVKDEALSPAKRLADKVRSIIGSPLSHYIGSTIFSHWANHNFAWESTPIKIGMPLNGFWMSRLFEGHSRFEVHLEGDMTAFDSVIGEPVKNVIRAIRKKGFESHQDSKAVADLIDSMYDQLDHQFLGHTSTGRVYKKGSGLTTGHSSTSMDNSVALVTFYMAAWKQITGLSAREFLHFCHLSCFGDDHILSVSALAPRGWNEGSIRKVMEGWGVQNRLAAKKLTDISFLGKFSRVADGGLRRELNAAGLHHVRRAVWHDKERLIGKLTGKPKKFDVTYRATRLYSYLTLTAHHREVYDAIVRELGAPIFVNTVSSRWGRLPTYEEVLQKWYAPSGPEPFKEMDADELWVEDGRMLVVGNPSWTDHMLQALSVVPDLLNPSLFNTGPGRMLQRSLAPHLSWVVDFVNQANGLGSLVSLDQYLRVSPYSFVDPTLVGPSPISDSFTTNLVRHWLFMSYYGMRPSLKSASLLDFVARKVSNLSFVLTGSIALHAPRDMLPFDLILVGAALSRLPGLQDHLAFVSSLALPNLHDWLDLLWNKLMVFIWTSVPASFNEVNAPLSLLQPGDPPLLIEAPTGTGKSTALVAHLAMCQAAPHRKLIVVEPRSILVHGLVDYVGKQYPVSTSGLTHNLKLDESAQVWFMTPQAFMSSLHLVSNLDLILVDEAHLPEAPLQVVLHSLPTLGLRSVAVTATPSDRLKQFCRVHVPIPIAQVFNVTTQKFPVRTVPDYFEQALQLCKSFPPSEKVLVILDTPEQVEEFITKLGVEAQALSSRHDPRLLDVNRFVSTSVCDVGVTLPGLDAVISPPWEYAGQGQRFRLSPEVLKQRRGRTGRTNNGTLLVGDWQGAPLEEKPPFTLSQGWKELFAAGVSPALGFELDPTTMADMFDIGTVDKAENRQYARAMHIYMENFRVLSDIESGLRDYPVDTGRPATLTPTSKRGQFADNVPRSIAPALLQVVDSLPDLARSIRAKAVSASLSDIFFKFPAGVMFQVSEVVNGLVEDPMNWKPSLPGLVHIWDEPDFDSEIAAISSLLDDLSADKPTDPASRHPFRVDLEGPIFPLRTQTVQ